MGEGKTFFVNKKSFPFPQPPIPFQKKLFICYSFLSPFSPNIRPIENTFLIQNFIYSPQVAYFSKTHLFREGAAQRCCEATRKRHPRGNKGVWGGLSPPTNSSMHIFITGATGFIGRHTVPVLLSCGHDVTALVRGSAPLPPKVRQVRGDFVTGEGLAEGLKGVDVVIHAAGVLFGRGAEAYFANTRGAVVLGQAMERAGTGKLVFVSSLAASGACVDGIKLTADGRYLEDLGIGEGLPVSVYGRSKLQAEQVLAACGNIKENMVVVRPPAVYGGGDRGLLPWFKSAKGGVLALYGSGEQPLSTLFVEDMVQALVCCIQPEARGVYHLDDGGNTTQKGFGLAMGEAMVRMGLRKSLPKTVAFPMPLVWLGARLCGFGAKLGMQPGWFNPDKYKELREPGWKSNCGKIAELGFKPQVGLAEGMEKTLTAYKKSGLIG